VKSCAIPEKNKQMLSIFFLEAKNRFTKENGDVSASHLMKSGNCVA